MSATFRHRLRVRYSECDLQGVVFNANYLTYLDEAITELWRATVDGGYRAMVEEGVDMVVAEAHLCYIAPARFDEEIEIEVRVQRLGTTAVTTGLTIQRDGEPLVEAELRHVFVRALEGGKTPIPEAVRAGLEAYLAAGAAT